MVNVCTTHPAAHPPKYTSKHSPRVDGAPGQRITHGRRGRAVHVRRQEHGGGEEVGQSASQGVTCGVNSCICGHVYQVLGFILFT
jgi:hypothetical protein